MLRESNTVGSCGHSMASTLHSSRRQCLVTVSKKGRLSYRLDLVLTLDQQVQQLLSVHGGLPVVGHQANEGCVPLVGNLGEGGATTAHQHLPDAVLK